MVSRLLAQIPNVWNAFNGRDFTTNTDGSWNTPLIWEYVTFHKQDTIKGY